MVSGDGTEGGEERRRGSFSGLDEYEPLLPDGHAPELYKTLSVSSSAMRPVQPN